MADEQDRKEHSNGPVGSLPAEDMPEQKSEEVQINYLPRAPKGEAGRTIHPRLPVPVVPEGEDVPDPAPSPPVKIEPPCHS